MATLTIEELELQRAELKGQIQELDTEYAGEVLPEDKRSSWNDLNEQHDQLEARIGELRTRAERIAEIGQDERNVERGATFNVPPQATRGGDLWDMSTIRASVTDKDGMVRELHERSRRVLDVATFPDEMVRREHAQEHIERLLYRDMSGEFAELILRTGSPTYRRAFSKYCAGVPLSNEEQRAFSLSTTGIPVPYVLDPTVIPVSNSVVNPLRAISSVDTITGSNEWRGLTAAAITASRVAEATEATDNAPTLAQPAIVCSKVHAFVPFSIESGQDWSGLESSMGRLFADAKDDEEATSFASGNGTPPNPFGVLTGATGTTPAATGLTITAANLTALEAALAPRYRPRAQFVANRAMYNIIRAIDTAGGANLWVRIGDGLRNSPASDGGNGNLGYSLLGYPANELSSMSATVVNATKIMLLGDFSMFKIIDRVGMTVELVPHVFGATSRFPIGQRGLYAYWRNGSKVVDAVGFRALTGTT